MSSLLLFIHRVVVIPFLIFLYFIAATISDKVRLGFRLRMLAPGSRKHGAAGCIWIHASSGEFEYAQPVIRKIKQENPAAKILVSFFSPSFYQRIKNDPDVDYVEPLPLDLPGPLRGFISHYQPRCLIIARTDLWPEVLFQCKKANIPIALLSAKLPHKLPLFLQPLRSWLVNQLTEVHCISEESLQYYKKMHPQLSVRLTGDTRFDQSFYRLNNPTKNVHHFIKPNPTPVLCAGSTWPEDEAALIPAVAKALHAKQLRLMIAPHEPTPVHLEKLLEQFKSLGIGTQMYSGGPNWTEPVLIVNEVGVLANLYTQADIAFIGGSFKKEVHSVMEALAAGLPCLIGPHFNNNPEAIEFSRLSIADISPVQSSASSQQLEKAIYYFIDNKEKLNTIKTQITAAVSLKQGATDKVYQHLKSWF